MLKKVASNLYVHKSNLSELLALLDSEEQKRVLRVLNSFQLPFEVVKYNKINGSISLIQCSTWNKLHEPIVEDSYCFNVDGSCKRIKGGTKVYHNKWEFVSEDYKGFDVEKEKQRTRDWNQIPNIRDLKCRIGNKDFWYKLLKEYNLEI